MHAINKDRCYGVFTVYVCVWVCVRSSDTVSELEISPPSLTTEQTQESAKCSKSSDLFTKSTSIHDDRSQDEEQTGVWSFTENQEKKMVRTLKIGSGL